MRDGGGVRKRPGVDVPAAAEDDGVAEAGLLGGVVGLEVGDGEVVLRGEGG